MRHSTARRGAMLVVASVAQLAHADGWRAPGTVVHPSVVLSGPLEPCVEIGAGDKHVTALTATGHPVAWGDNLDAQCAAPNGTFVHVAAQGTTSIALRDDGAAVMWGHGPVKVFPGPFIAVDCATGWGVGITPAGNLIQFYYSGTLGPPIVGPFTACQITTTYGVAIRTDGSLHAWSWGGSDPFGLMSPPAGSFAKVSAAKDHAIALRDDGEAVCWGNPANGQCAAPPGPFLDVAARESGSLAIRGDGTIVAWGTSVVPPSGQFIKVAAGSVNAALRADGSVVTWGGAYYGLEGTPALPFVDFVKSSTFSNPNWYALRSDGSILQSAGPQFPASEYREFARTSSTVFGLRSDGTIDHLNAALYGEDAPPVGAFAHVDGMLYHAGALTADGQLACWGLNAWGQCDVPSGAYASFAIGGYHTVALREDGTFAAWGDNYYGQCDDPGGTFTAISAGLGHTVGLRADGSLVAWGRNNVGQCNVSGGPYVAVQASFDWTRAIDATGHLSCWGSAYGLPSCAEGQIWRVSSIGAVITIGPDCDGDFTPDFAEIFHGAIDANGNGVPDDCESLFGDLDGDGRVGAADLAVLLGAWGAPGGPADLDGDGVVGAADMALLLGAWTV